MGSHILSEMDKAYLAGFIDGEGSIGIHCTRHKNSSQSPTHVARLNITQADMEFLGELRSSLGGVLVKKPPHPTWQEQGVLEWRGLQARLLLEAILPYLRIKKLQAEGAIELERSKRKRGSCRLSESDLEYREWVKQRISDLNQKRI